MSMTEHNLPLHSVSEISQALKRTVETAFDRVRVRGEISGFKRAASGHMYLALKDADAVLDTVVWRGVAGRLGLRPEDGMEVVCTGRLTTFAGRSKYQLVVERMELAGEGALLKLLEARRQALAAEGLFDAERKRPLPFLPEVIGVVTSPTGAVIRDILHRLADRFPRHVLLWPVRVQGEGAAEEIAAAIEGFNRLDGSDGDGSGDRRGAIPRPDLLIVARGGGSLEDLWAFNEEIVVRAAAASALPLISAIGHETDTTLIDHAADRRAPTPTAAAELAVPVRTELMAQVETDSARLLAAVTRRLREGAIRVDGLGRGLGDPRHWVEAAAQRLDDRSERLALAARARLQRDGQRLQALWHRTPSPGEAIERLQTRWATLATRLAGQGRQQLAAATQRLAVAAAGLRPGNMRDRLLTQQDRLIRLTAQLAPATERRLTTAGDRLAAQERLLESVSHHRILERGFALVEAAADKSIIRRADAVQPGQALTLQFADGLVAVTVEGDKPPSRQRRGGRKKAPPPTQGDLFGA